MKELWRDNKIYIGTLATYISFVIILYAIVISLSIYKNKLACEAQTRNIGFPAHWSYLGGCQIEVNPGKWIPLDSYYYKQP